MNVLSSHNSRDRSQRIQNWNQNYDQEFVEPKHSMEDQKMLDFINRSPSDPQVNVHPDATNATWKHRRLQTRPHRLLQTRRQPIRASTQGERDPMEEVRKMMNLSQDLCDIVRSMKLFADAPVLAQAQVLERKKIHLSKVLWMSNSGT